MSFMSQQRLNIVFKQIPSVITMPASSNLLIMLNFDNSAANVGSLAGNIIYYNTNSYNNFTGGELSATYNYATSESKNAVGSSLSSLQIGNTAGTPGKTLYVGYLNDGNGNAFKWPSTTGSSYSFWFKLTDINIASGTYPSLWRYRCEGNPTNGGAIGVGFTPTGTSINKMYFTFGVSATGVENVVGITKGTMESTYDVSFTGKWNHAALSVTSGGAWTLVINGKLYSSDISATTSASLTSLNNTATPIVFGVDALNTYPRWSGYLDCFRVYNVSLSEAQMKYLYNQGI